MHRKHAPLLRRWGPVGSGFGRLAKHPQAIQFLDRDVSARPVSYRVAWLLRSALPTGAGLVVATSQASLVCAGTRGLRARLGVLCCAQVRV